jgi:uncharacterized protein
MKKTKYMNSYVAGILLGILLIATIYISGRGLGASGAIKSVAVTSVEALAPSHAENTQFFLEYTQSHIGNPLKSWLVFEVFGVLIGAFLSGLYSDRIGLKLEKGTNTTAKIRIWGAIIGGALFGFGSQLGRGCTSGSALSGMAVMSTGGIITMFAIFGGAFLFAYFFRKLWI